MPRKKKRHRGWRLAQKAAAVWADCRSQPGHGSQPGQPRFGRVTSGPPSCVIITNR